LLNPPPGSRAEAAAEYGIDLTLLIEQLKLTPAERAIKLQRATRALSKKSAASPAYRSRWNSRSQFRHFATPEVFEHTVLTLDPPALIESKKAAGRSKDILALFELESLLEAARNNATNPET
jgi:hypothetical protein